MLSCKEVIELASRNLDRELSLWQRIGLRFHVAMCKACSAYKRRIEDLNKLFSEKLRTGAPPAGGESLSEDRIALIKVALRSQER